MADSTNINFRCHISMDDYDDFFASVAPVKFINVWFIFNDGYEMGWEVDLPLRTLYRFNEQRPIGSKNPRGLYVAPRFERVSILFRLQAVGVNKTEFIYEEYPKGSLRKYWRLHMQAFKRRFAIMKRNILKRYKERMKVNHHYRELFGGESC